MKNKDGGPAFPNFVERGQWNEERKMYVPQMTAVNGMSLRDWFAGMAIQSLKVDPYSPEAMAIEAYRLADAMLKAREG